MIFPFHLLVQQLRARDSALFFAIPFSKGREGKVVNERSINGEADGATNLDKTCPVHL